MEIETNISNIDELIPEEDFLEYVEDEFTYQIKERGIAYYKNGHVIKCVKNKNNYLAKVRGSSSAPYKVQIYNMADGLAFKCTCPCDFPCKHIYATILAIANQEYEIVNLKKEIKEHKSNLQSIIEKIPAEKLKEYLLSPLGLGYVCFEVTNFENYFREYLPRQSYEFYYNNLYNSLVLENEDNMLTSYINRIKSYLGSNDFNESFKIIKSIIEAYNDAGYLNFDDNIINIFSILTMIFRIIYKKSNLKLKEEINKWLEKVKNNNYYNNLYLEDMVSI